MADAADKRRQKAKINDMAPAQSVKGKGDEAVSDGSAMRVNLRFYDVGTLAPLSPPIEGTEIELLKADGTVLTNVCLQHDTKASMYYIAVPPAAAQSLDSASDEETAEDVEIPCDIPRDASPLFLMKRFTTPVAVNCQSYQMMSTASDHPAQDQEACTPVPIGLAKLEQSYTFSLLAYDKCIGDYIAHPDALLDEVKLELREVEGPRKASGTTTTNTFRSRSFSATTKEGFAEIPGLAFGQLYETYISAPPGYVCTNPPPPRLLVNRGQNYVWPAAFQPCGEFPSRSVIFVQQACPGMRVPNLSFEARGQAGCADDQGIWNMKPGTTGRIDFQALGKAFSPPSIELKEDSPMAFVIEVADQQVQVGRKSRFQFVDESGQPFRNREIRLAHPGGYKENVRTDPDGWFEAPEGSLAWADEDDSGFALDGVQLLTK